MKLTGIILAGGKSSRMGQDKGLMLLDDKPMIQHVIAALKPVVDEIIIISNQKGYDIFGYPVYEDLIKDKGPLAGISTGLHHANFDNSVVLSCDTPFVNSSLLSLLINNSKDFEITIPKNNDKTHQLIGIFSKSCMEKFNNCIENNHLRASSVFESLNLNVVDASHFDKKIFTNINTQYDIKH
jgi:molybdopterin-guanine dinucleotide biosynthesis protein A